MFNQHPCPILVEAILLGVSLFLTRAEPTPRPWLGLAPCLLFDNPP